MHAKQSKGNMGYGGRGMKRCEICGNRFRLLAKNRYEIVKRPTGLNCLTQAAVYFNAFDCPHCGCQNVIGVVEKDVVETVKEGAGE